MQMISILILMSITLSLFILLSLYYTSTKSFADQEKSSPFECGFNPQNSPRLPFSIQFFIMGVVFLIFDVEIALLIPLPLLIHSVNNLFCLMISSTFILILLVGLFYEWSRGSLTWIK